MSKIRSYNRFHLRAWVFGLEKDGQVSCLFKSCPFIAFDIPEIIDHHRSCRTTDVHEFICQYCRKATDKLYKLHNHVLMHHENEVGNLPPGVVFQFEDPEKNDDKREIPKVMKEVWKMFIETKGYLKCLIPSCRQIAEDQAQMEQHYVACSGNPGQNVVCDVCRGTNPDSSFIARHKTKFHADDKVQCFKINSIPPQVRSNWQTELRTGQVARCITQGCRYASYNFPDINRHYTYCRAPLPQMYEVCDCCNLWWENGKVRSVHVQKQFDISNNRREENGNDEEQQEARQEVPDNEASLTTSVISQPAVEVVSSGGIPWQMDIPGVPNLMDFSYNGISQRIFASSLEFLRSTVSFRHVYHRVLSAQPGEPVFESKNGTKQSKNLKRKIMRGGNLRTTRRRHEKKNLSSMKKRKRRVRKPRSREILPPPVIPSSVGVNYDAFTEPITNGDNPSTESQDPGGSGLRRSTRRKFKTNLGLRDCVRQSRAVTKPIESRSAEAPASTSVTSPSAERPLVTYSRTIRRSNDKGVSSAAVWPLRIVNELNSSTEDEISIRDFQNLSQCTQLSFDDEAFDAVGNIDEIELLNEESPEVVVEDQMIDLNVDHDHCYILPPDISSNFSKDPDFSLIDSTAKNSKLETVDNPGFDKSDFRNVNKLFDFEFFSHRIGVNFVVCPLYDTSKKPEDLTNDETPPAEPVRKRGRPRRKVVEEKEAEEMTNANKDEENEDVDDAGAVSPAPTQRRSSRRKRGRASFRKEESEAEIGDQDSLDTNVSDPPVTTKRRKGLPYDDIRVNYFTKLKNPSEQVKCGVCSETMTAKEYQSRHLQRHSYICWLEGEPPMDNEDEDVLARYLYRVYIKGKNVIFTCEKCNETKKSAKGFVTHRALCGKTGDEVDQVMAKCGLCGRVVMPYCLESHMMAKHPKKGEGDGESDESHGKKVRLAASKCLKTLSSITARPEYQTPLRGKHAEDEDDNDGDGDGSYEGDVLYSVVKRRTTKILKTLWGTSLKADQEAKCMVRGCEFATNRMKTIIRHYQSCTVEPLEYKCRECTFQSFSRDVVMKHVKTNHDDLTEDRKVIPRGPRNGNIAGIPFVTQAESRLPPSCCFFYEAVKWTNELRKKCLSINAVFGNYDFKSDDWAPLDAVEAKPYLPRQSKSMKFYVGKSVEKKEWEIVQTFEAHRGIDDTISTLFCGGPLSSMAWAPIDGPQQFLALSTDLSMDQPRFAKDVSPAPGCVQIWSASRGLGSADPQDIKLEYILCHDEGSRAWDLKWCPGGSQTEQRMGMLALATSSGVIPIYSLPWPALLPDLGRRIKTFKPKPVFGLILDSERAQCTTVSWSQVKPHRILAAGFTSGIVALWDLTQESQLLKRANNLLPFKVFHAHSNIVTSVALSPTSEEHLVTSARDKIIKCWDVKDTTCPQSQNHRGTAMAVDWVYSWMSSALIIDTVSSSFPQTTVLLYPYRYVAHQTNIICGTLVDSTPLGLSVNSWMNAILTSYDNGQVSFVFARNQMGTRDERKKFVKIMIQPELHDFRPSNTDCNTYAKASEKFGVTFFTDLLADHSNRLKTTLPNPVNAYPILAANKVVWNPNPSSCLNFAVGYQSGFVLIADVMLTQADDKYMKNAFASVVTQEVDAENNE